MSYGQQIFRYSDNQIKSGQPKPNRTTKTHSDFSNLYSFKTTGQSNLDRYQSVASKNADYSGKSPDEKIEFDCYFGNRIDSNEFPKAV